MRSLSVIACVLPACLADPYGPAAPPDQLAASVEAPPPWAPGPGTSWQWQLLGAIDTSVDVDMYDIDLFDAPQATIDQLHADGRVVICYFSAGSWENWRPDASRFPAPTRGDPLTGWPGERWLDVRDATVRQRMLDRLDLAVLKRCDGVEPDNVDGYANRTGFPLTYDDQLDFNGLLASEAHLRGLSVGLKNDLGQIRDLEPSFDWALNEECFAYRECALLRPFVDAGKAVFHVEYPARAAQVTSLANRVCHAGLPFESLIKPPNLTAPRIDCATWP
ncbi:MAG TPA: endo alpha-1,4 polygalactosaminidase [Myxococcota bacterium]|nr:endo alpha-1,4 polygalactosaminidase [Myxococcota bacterium]